MQRLFFSLKFTASQQQQLLSYQQQALSLCPQGRPIEVDNLHLTLFFLGQVSEAQKQRLITAASQLTAPGFKLTLDYLAVFAQPKILYLAPGSIPAELLNLQQQVAAVCKAEGFNDLHQQYRPHITLLRHAIDVDGDVIHSVTPVTFNINEFALYHSTQLAGRLQYLPLNCFTLTA